MTETLKFPGDDVPVPTPTVDKLRESALGWLGLSSLHLAEGESHGADGSLDTAIDQLSQGVEQIQRAINYFKEARELQRRA